MKDLYEILGLDNTATAEEIKRAYRKIAMKYHPDKNPGNKEAEQQFKKSAEAYSVLSNEHKRAQYDQFGHAGVGIDRKSTRLNSSHKPISYAVFCLKKKTIILISTLT